MFRKVKAVIIKRYALADSSNIRKFATENQTGTSAAGIFIYRIGCRGLYFRPPFSGKTDFVAQTRTIAHCFPRYKDLKMKTRQLLLFVGLLTLFAATGLSAQETTVGNASYYGNKFHGRRMSDGSRYHRDSLTCAHRTLPFGTMLKVRNAKNGNEVVVKVTDRGPFGHGRIIDLSYAAAKQIDMVAAGVARVEVTPISEAAGSGLGTPATRSLPELKLIDPTTGYFYTLSEWKAKEQAELEQARIREAQNRTAAYIEQQKQKLTWRIYDDKKSAKAEKTESRTAPAKD